ncbi:MAG: DNA polymerase III subunit gamma/tau [Nitrospirae bacterium]|nr:DNA polymerase III subunit gamma/tau [Nitrospirota bacterium]
MDYQVSARKYRPGTFDDVIGQPHVVQTLMNAVSTKRVAHAYLFSGTRGVGKTTVARILAKALNCEQGPTSHPCDTCENCREIAQGNSVDVIEIDGASNTSVDDVREIRENVRFTPFRGQFRVYLIDEVHMLSNSAFNALLKTLEEPPAHVQNHQPRGSRTALGSRASRTGAGTAPSDFGPRQPCCPCQPG